MGRPMKSNREVRNKMPKLCPLNVWQRRQKHTLEKKVGYLANGTRNTEFLLVEEWN